MARSQGSHPSPKTAQSRTRRTQWLDAGLDILRENGEDQLTIESLCARLGRTKGSYYHHFTDVAAYLDALLAHWADKQTAAPIVVIGFILEDFVAQRRDDT